MSHEDIYLIIPNYLQGPYKKHGLTLISKWISNYRPSTVWDEITNPFPNFNSTTFEVREWMSNIIPHLIIYIIITKNICYLLWNKGLWRSLNNTYPIFLTPCIRCINQLYDSYDLTDVIWHFIPSLLQMVQNVDLLWRHRYKSRSPAIVT